MGSSTEELREACIGLAKSGPAWSDGDVTAGGCIASALQQLLVDKIKAQCVHKLPVHFCYSNDATGFLTQQRHVHSSGAGGHQTRGRGWTEFLMERLMVNSMKPSGDIVKGCLLRESVPLLHGKGADPCFTAGIEFMSPLRQLHPVGLLHQHILSDGALFTALRRRFLQHREAMYDPAIHSTTSTATLDIGKLTHIPTAVACIAHQCHNGVKWGLHPVLGSPDTWKAMHVSVESLRNNTRSIYLQLPRWLRDKVAFTNARDSAAADSRLWHLLGVPATKIELFVEVSPRWDGTWLHVNPELLHHPNAMGKIAEVWQLCMRWQAFKESRWCSIGTASRNLLRSLAVGVEDLFSRVSGPFTSAFREFDNDSRLFCSVAALASFPMESMLCEILADDRLARRLDETIQVIQDEVEVLENVPDHIWKYLSQVAGLRFHHELRHKVLQAAYTSVGYVHRYGLQRFALYPWKLTQGDLKQSLTDLAAKAIEEIPEDDVATRNIWRLLHTGYGPPIAPSQICYSRM